VVTLFKEGTHVTDVTIQYDGEVAVGSGGSGGEFYDRISAEERPKLLSALVEAAGGTLPVGMSDAESNETILAFFLLLFGERAKDPYVDIGKFLDANNVRYKGEYWPDR
jgi:hypothetical protein